MSNAATNAPDTIFTLTAKQKLALMLRRAGHNDSVIATRLGITRQATNRLIQRGLRAEKAFRQAVQDFLKSA